MLLPKRTANYAHTCKKKKKEGGANSKEELAVSLTQK